MHSFYVMNILLIHQHLAIVDVVLGVLEPVVDGGGVGLRPAADGDVVSRADPVQLTWDRDFWRDWREKIAGLK